MKTKMITQSGLLLAIALAIQSLHLPTIITGSIINAVLITSAVYPGIWSSILIGCITPLAALGLGIVHPVTAPLVPVIMGANATLGIVFHLLRKRNNYIALFGAALAKYLVFYIALNYLIEILNMKFPAPMVAAFQLPQLLTAIIGGVIGVTVVKKLEKIDQKPEEDMTKTLT